MLLVVPPYDLQYPVYNSVQDERRAEEDFHYAYSLSFLLALIGNLICGEQQVAEDRRCLFFAAPRACPVLRAALANPGPPACSIVCGFSSLAADVHSEEQRPAHAEEGGQLSSGVLALLHTPWRVFSPLRPQPHPHPSPSTSADCLLPRHPGAHALSRLSDSDAVVHVPDEDHVQRYPRGW